VWGNHHAIIRITLRRKHAIGEERPDGWDPEKKQAFTAVWGGKVVSVRLSIAISEEQLYVFKARLGVGETIRFLLWNNGRKKEKSSIYHFLV
jgi:hypothetical protein